MIELVGSMDSGMSNVRYNSTGEGSTLKVSRQSSTPVNNTAFVCWCCPKMLLHVAPLDRRTIDIYLIVFAELQYLNLFTTVTLSIPLNNKLLQQTKDTVYKLLNKKDHYHSYYCHRPLHFSSSAQRKAYTHR